MHACTYIISNTVDFTLSVRHRHNIGLLLFFFFNPDFRIQKTSFVPTIQGYLLLFVSGHGYYTHIYTLYTHAHTRASERTHMQEK